MPIKVGQSPNATLQNISDGETIRLRGPEAVEFVGSTLIRRAGKHTVKIEKPKWLEKIESHILENSKTWIIIIALLDLILLFLGIYLFYDSNNMFNFLLYLAIVSLFTFWPLGLILSKRKP